MRPDEFSGTPMARANSSFVKKLGRFLTSCGPPPAGHVVRVLLPFAPMDEPDFPLG